MLITPSIQLYGKKPCADLLKPPIAPTDPALAPTHMPSTRVSLFWCVFLGPTR
ncbi:hypothetical protein B0H14DRAFT_3449225 [Mycena olivaceomarginata]|nr:hypothetical protein B0H14DRAFT_3449225 [Mycena olivaceomarginata]